MGYQAAAAGILVAMFLLMTGMTIIAIRRGKTGRARLREMALLVVLPAYQMVLLLCFLLACRMEASILFFGLMVVLFSAAVDFVVVRALDRLEENRRLEERLAGLYRQRQLEMDFYALNRENVRRMDAVKRRLLLQIAQAEELLEQKKGFGEVKAVLNDACRDIQQTRLNRYCGNPLVNSILTIKEKGAREKGIEVRFNVFLEKELPVDPVDLCSLFCNLLDNAIEACGRIRRDDMRKWISVKADYRAGCLVLQVENTSDMVLPEAEEMPHTSKAQKEEHGLGLKLVERIVKKYHGRFYMKQEKIYIVVDTILNLAYEDGRAYGGQPAQEAI